MSEGWTSIYLSINLFIYLSRDTEFLNQFLCLHLPSTVTICNIFLFCSIYHIYPPISYFSPSMFLLTNIFYVSMCLFIYPSFYLSLHTFIYLSIYPPFYLIYLSIHTYTYIFLSNLLSIYLSTHISSYLSISLSYERCRCLRLPPNRHQHNAKQMLRQT